MLARRATEIALFARQRTLALEAAKLWQQLDPKADRARQMVASLAISGAGSDLKAELQRVLIEAAANDKSLGDAFLQLNQALAAQTDKAAAFRLVQDLAKPYPNVREGWFAVALAGLQHQARRSGHRSPRATRAADRALELKPGWDRAALVKADILAKSSPDAAIAFLKEFLAATPDARAVAGALAQLYVEQKRFGDARAIFQRLWDEDPEDREFEFAVAAISLQMKDYATAQRLLEELDKAGYGEKGVVPFYLAPAGRGNQALRRGDRPVPRGHRRGSRVARQAAHRRDDREEGRPRARRAATWTDCSPSRPNSGSSSRRRKRSCCAMPATTRARTRFSRRRWSARPIRSTCSTMSRWSPRSSTASTRSSRGSSG